MKSGSVCYSVKMMKKVTYLDYASATPIDHKTAKAMSEVAKLFANGSSIHKDGVEVRNIINDCRKRVADCIFAHSDEIIFTGSGTESDALAIMGVVRSYKRNTNLKPHIITTNIEHSAVLENCKFLERNGEAELTYISVNEKGLVDPKDVKNALRENTALVSVMYANNEIGTIQPIAEIAKVIRHFRKNRKLEKEIGFPLFHTDACQAMNYLPTENIEKLGVDLMTFNSSKIYGPKGVGVLYKKRGVILPPLYLGGGQEFNLHSGTENLIGIVGVASALEETNKIKDSEKIRLTKLRDYFFSKISNLSKVSGYEIIINGDKEERLPNNINISIFGISSELIVVELDARGIEISEKSACGSISEEGSHVIEAIRKVGLPKGISFGKGSADSLRISLGRKTTKTDINKLIKGLFAILKKYKEWK